MTTATSKLNGTRASLPTNRTLAQEVLALKNAVKAEKGSFLSFLSYLDSIEAKKPSLTDFCKRVDKFLEEEGGSMHLISKSRSEFDRATLALARLLPMETSPSLETSKTRARSKRTNGQILAQPLVRVVDAKVLPVTEPKTNSGPPYYY